MKRQHTEVTPSPSSPIVIKERHLIQLVDTEEPWYPDVYIWDTTGADPALDVLAMIKANDNRSLAIDVLDWLSGESSSKGKWPARSLLDMETRAALHALMTSPAAARGTWTKVHPFKALTDDWALLQGPFASVLYYPWATTAKWMMRMSHSFSCE